jgi:hypothetical protein
MILRIEIYSLVMKMYKSVCSATPSATRIARLLANEELERNWVKDVVD